MFEFPVGNSPLKRISPCRDRTAEVSEMLHDKDQMHSLSPKHSPPLFIKSILLMYPCRNFRDLGSEQVTHLVVYSQDRFSNHSAREHLNSACLMCRYSV